MGLLVGLSFQFFAKIQFLGLGIESSSSNRPQKAKQSQCAFTAVTCVGRPIFCQGDILEMFHTST